MLVFITRLTQSAFCLRQSGALFVLVFGFSRSARKNRTQMIVKYHAAAGRICFKRRPPRNSCSVNDANTSYMRVACRTVLQ
jgi:hypothetical protein